MDDTGEIRGRIKSLQDTQAMLGNTLKSLKVSQERLQTAVKAAKSETAAFRYGKLKLHGLGSLAYSSLQRGMLYFMREDLGYLCYVPLSDGPDSVLVLADPICAPASMRQLLTEFLTVKRDPVFIHISHDTAAVLNELGFHVNELGVETFIEIQKFDLVGNKKQQLRNARNGARKDGLTVVEVNAVDNMMIKALREISDSWMKEKVAGSSEMQLLVRPLVYVDEVDVRKFVALKDGEIVGFVIFDPMYEEGEVVGYIANQLRSNFERTYSVVDFIILEALDVFKAEGKREISLGLSPMYKVDDSGEFKHSKLLKSYFQYSFEKANYVYNFKSLARHKSLYRPELPGAREEKVYCAMHERFMLTRMLDVVHTLGLHPIRQALRHYLTLAVLWVKTLFTPQKPQAPDKAPAAKTTGSAPEEASSK